MQIHSDIPLRDYGPSPYVTNVTMASIHNTNFRTTLWTGAYIQMTLMSIPPCGEVGLEIHPDNDQLIRIEQGRAFVKMGKYKDDLSFTQHAGRDDVIFIPAGTWHNIINTEKAALKLSVLYAPPHHPKGTIHRTKADADNY